MIRQRIRMALCVAASALLHVAVLTPLAIRTLAGARTLPDVPEPQETPNSPLPELDVLGVEKPTDAAVAWIGYDTYQEHLARLSEVEQAAFHLKEAVGNNAPGELQAATEPPQPESAAAKDAPSTDAVPEPPSLRDATEPQPEELPIAVMPEIDESFKAPEMPAVPAEDSGDLIPAIEEPRPRPTLTALKTLIEKLFDSAAASERSPDPVPNPSESTTPTSSPTAPVPRPITAASPAQETVPSKPVPPSPAPPEPGANSDKEADPSSVIDVPPENWKLGQPLAAQGLDLRTRRPRFDELTRVTASPGNPVAAIAFDSRGVAVRVTLLTSSGDSRVDEPVINALYGWRATGKPLAKLRDKDTFTITIRILLRGE